jgi:DNA-binding winged helix-turn-helix (wHTH) protein/Tfp pilus assembly protein PilF
MFWQTQTSYEFGPFRVDTRERRLLRNGKVVPLRPKVFDILLVLVENSGHILTKDDVMRRVWSNAVVEEGNIARNISTLRSALGEDSKKQQYIETIPWRGYRFVARVKEVHDSSRPTIDSIAVLPFVNVKEDPHDEYLCDGVTESLITSLAQLTNLRVTSRNSAFRYKRDQIDAQTAGRQLKVQAVVMGRVGVADDMVSVSVELVDTSDDRHIWGAQFVRSPTDLLGLHDTIARKISEAIQLERPARAQLLISPRHTENHEAYSCYLKGRYFFNKLTPDGVQKGIEYFQQAIEQDPNYALAYAGLGDCHNYLAQRDEARSAVLKALELDETLGEAHASLGFFRFLYDWDFAGAEKEFEHALARSPNYAEAHHWYAIYLANLGRHQEAEQQAKQAVELDPLSLLMNMTPALNLYLGRQYDQAIEQLQKILNMDPSFLAARSVMGTVLVLKGSCEEAMGEYEKVLEQIKGAPTVEVSVKAIMAQGYARCGEKLEAQKLLEEVLAAGTASPYSVAGIYSALGKNEAAFEFLERACEQHDVQLVSLKVDPSLDGVRFDVRFEKLLDRVGIPK